MTSWTDALTILLDRSGSVTGPWMIVGSAATALQGAAVTPGDIDILARTPTVVAEFAAAMADFLPDTDALIANSPDWESTPRQPILFSGAWTMARWHVNGFKVEVACIEEAIEPADALNETLGAAIWEVRRPLSWQGYTVPVAPLEVQLPTNLKRGLTGRVEAIAAVLQRTGCDRDLLARALAGRGCQAPAGLLLD